MLKLLKLNTLLLFLILTLPWLFVLYVTFGSYDYDMYIGIIAYTIFLIWFIGLDSELTKRIPVKIRPSNTLFLINLSILYLLNCILVIFLEPGTYFNVTGLAAVPFLYLFYAWFSIYSHLSKLLTYAEEENEVPLSKRIGEMVLFFFFFIGLWWLQPRIRKVLEKAEIKCETFSSFS
jgi:hypothetical protein